MAIEFTVPIQTSSTLNLREHWSKKAKRNASQRRAVAYCVPREVKALGPLLIVRLTRKSPRQLDSDNLAGALKAVRDQVAASLRIDDGSQLIRWEYAQEANPEPSVTVSIRAVFDAPEPSGVLGVGK